MEFTFQRKEREFIQPILQTEIAVEFNTIDHSRFRAEGPTVCLAQAIGLGVKAAIRQ